MVCKKRRRFFVDCSSFDARALNRDAVDGVTNFNKGKAGRIATLPPSLFVNFFAALWLPGKNPRVLYSTQKLGRRTKKAVQVFC